MGFGVSKGASNFSGAKSQDDIVAERTEVRPDMMEEDLPLPGLSLIHTFGDNEMIEFFTMVNKSRINIREVELTLGDGYKQREEPCRVPNANMLHTLDYAGVARVYTMALASSPKAIGFRALVSYDKDNNISSKLYVKIAEQDVHGPEVDDQGNVVTPGDPEFKPRLRIVTRS